MASLQERIKEGLKSGNITLSSADVAADAAPEKKGEDIQGDVTTKVPAKDAVDPMFNAADKGDLNSLINSVSGGTAMDMLKVELTERERAAFLDAMITGERLELPFSLFAGKVNVVFRSRAQSESLAIVNRLSGELRDGQIVMEAEYGNRLRSMLLACQVQQMNGTGFQVLQEPLNRMVVGDNITLPGWLDQVKYWESLSEGLVTALYEALKKFELKYWTMVKNAEDQNFWKPAESI